MIRFAALSDRPRIYGHRGCRGLRPENTLPAFLHALEWGVDGLELDVIISADNEVVVSHEAWLNAAICLHPDGHKLTPEQGLSYNLYQHSYADIRRIECGSQRHPSFPEQVLGSAYKPLLKDVFTAVFRRCREVQQAVPIFSVELKSSPATDGIYHPSPRQFVARVLQELTECVALTGHEFEVLLMSFDHRVVEAVRQHSALPVCLLIEDAEPVERHIERLGFVPDVLGPDYGLIDDTLLNFCSQKQLPIVTWTVNDAALMRDLAARGVSGITTDYPDRASAVFSA